MIEYSYWIVHVGSDSRFASKSANEAAEIVAEWNKIALEYALPPTNKVEVVSSSEIEIHSMELARREKEGDRSYFEP